ncbi:hypothetical protein JV46_12530 [Solemya velum gill symbiont]|uniref:Uncharacterized protein n=1 Tax=Solemya velum gill symbiont TaxID=2340 RepID=A0A0B0HDT9_SOVGS|nr:hypothetical protein [Solemya velum gill symbiont]KHF25626.1 hypothetical protein JV46_12530 [Solemya velum gill symbiont]
MTIRQGIYLIALLAFLCLQTAFAQEKEGEVVLTAPQRAEKMIILNENGVVGVTYSYPWSFKWAEYASSLGELFVKEIYSAQNECENTLAKLKANEDALLGSRADSYIGSLLSKPTYEIANSHLVSSLLQKYANRDWVDPESRNDPGAIQPLSGELCSDLRIDSQGLISQMFPTPTNTRSIGGEVWGENVCGELYIVKVCLSQLARIHISRTKTNKEPIHKVDFPDSSVFQKLAPQKIKGGKESIENKAWS